MLPQYFSRQLSLLLSGALLFVLCAAPQGLAKTKEDKAAALAARVKTELAQFGTGPEARIVVKLRDKTQVAGYVSHLGENTFVITDLKTGAATTVPYPDLTQVKGNHLSTKAKIAIVAGIAAGLILLIGVLTDPFHNS